MAAHRRRKPRDRMRRFDRYSGIVEQLFEKIQTELDAGYRRIKIKIKPGWDYDVIRQVREQFGDIPLMADANSAYTLNDIDCSSVWTNSI